MDGEKRMANVKETFIQKWNRLEWFQNFIEYKTSFDLSELTVFSFLSMAFCVLMLVMQFSIDNITPVFEISNISLILTFIIIELMFCKICASEGIDGFWEAFGNKFVAVLWAASLMSVITLIIQMTYFILRHQKVFMWIGAVITIIGIYVMINYFIGKGVSNNR
jgi:hypothetical protein